jgi:methylenetetrahydrofolate dehydrogenase (NADP+)/methenyltetrahydrofolate cyclohydrolase
MSHKIISGKTVAAPILEDVARRVEVLQEKGWLTRLASIEIGDVPAVSLYVRNQRRVCEEVGITFEHRQFPQDITQPEMLAAIQAMNVDPRISGIILQRPIPEHLTLKYLQLAIHPTKDVEGMNPANIGKVVYGDFLLGPCTSLASVELLRSTGLTLQGLEVVIVGHSEIVGKPIALHLLKELATITVCHHETRNLAHHTRRAEALFVAVGKAGLITGDMVKPGAAVIDIGINQVEMVEEDGRSRKKTVGDIDFDSVHEVAGWVTPVPGGVGPVTLAILVRNTVAALEQAQRNYEIAMKS